jgi:hypothetical protein
MYLLCQRYDISDVGLAKVCKRHHIPRPPPGYWAKLAAGKTVQKRPALVPDQDYDITINPCKSSFRASPSKKQEAAPAIVVKQHLRGLHPLVIQTKIALAADAECGRWERRPTHLPRLAVHVEPTSERRALLILDALVRGIEAMGWSVEVENRSGWGWSSSAIIGDVRVGFCLHSIRGIAPEARKPPALRLGLTTHWDHRQNWNDAKKQCLENVLGDFLKAMARQASWLSETVAAEQRKLADAVAERERRRAVVTAYEDERRRVARLRQDSEDYQEAETIRAYIAARLESHPEELEWADWAYKQAARIDPLSDSPPSMLDSPPNRSWYGRDAGVSCSIWTIERFHVPPKADKSE